MKICICDDSPNVHDILKEYLQHFTITESIFEITDLFSAEQLIDHYKQNHEFDIIFLDIEMSKISGIEAAEKIRSINSETIIIFISNFPNYVFDVFRCEAFHFLVKPIKQEEFEDVFNRALHKYNTIHSTLKLKWQNERYIIKINSIKYVEGYKRHITIYTDKEKYESIGKLPEIFKVLEPHGFIRTHQGFIVNMDHIKRFDPADVVLFDGTKVMISVRKRAEALQIFDEYLKRRKW